MRTAASRPLARAGQGALRRSPLGPAPIAPGCEPLGAGPFPAGSEPPVPGCWLTFDVEGSAV